MALNVDAPAFATGPRPILGGNDDASRGTMVVVVVEVLPPETDFVVVGTVAAFVEEDSAARLVVDGGPEVGGSAVEAPAVGWFAPAVAVETVFVVVANPVDEGACTTRKNSPNRAVGF